MNKTYQAIFSDIDGTFLNSNHEITSYTLEQIETAGQHGIPFTLISGRGLSCIKPIVQKNRLSCCIAACNGALILDEQGEIIYENGMALSEAQKIIHFIEDKELDITWNIFTASDWIVKDLSHPAIVREERIVEAKAHEMSPYELPSDTIVDKIMCICTEQHLPEYEKLLRQTFSEYAIVRSSNILLEINAPGVNKAKALQYVCRQKGIPVEHSIAFGDNYNDLEMLHAAGRGIVMGNAPEEIKRQFAVVTKDCDHDGVGVVLAALSGQAPLSELFADTQR